MISLEENGTLSKMQRLQKKVLQEAYDHALKRKIVSGRCGVIGPGMPWVVR